MKLDLVLNTLLILGTCTATHHETLEQGSLRRRAPKYHMTTSSGQIPRILRRGTGNSPKTPNKPKPGISAGQGQRSAGGSGNKEQTSPKNIAKDTKPLVPPLDLRKHIPGLANPDWGTQHDKGTQTGSSLERSNSGLSWTSTSSMGKSPQHVKMGGGLDRSSWASPLMDFSAKTGFITKHGGAKADTSGSPKNSPMDRRPEGTRPPSPQRFVDMTFPESVIFGTQPSPKREKQD